MSEESKVGMEVLGAIVALRVLYLLLSPSKLIDQVNSISLFFYAHATALSAYCRTFSDTRRAAAAAKNTLIERATQMDKATSAVRQIFAPKEVQ